MPQTNAATMATAGAFTGRVSGGQAFRYGRFGEKGRRDGFRRFRSGGLSRLWRRLRAFSLLSRSGSLNPERALTDRTRGSGFLVRRERAARSLLRLPSQRAVDRARRSPDVLA